MAPSKPRPRPPPPLPPQPQHTADFFDHQLIKQHVAAIIAGEGEENNDNDNWILHQCQTAFGQRPVGTFEDGNGDDVIEYFEYLSYRELFGKQLELINAITESICIQLFPPSVEDQEED